MIHYEESEAIIHKCWKKYLFKSFFNIHKKTLEQEYYFNEISYLKYEILLKKKLQHRGFTVSFSKFFKAATFNNISGWLLLVGYKHE